MKDDALKKKFEDAKDQKWGCNTVNPKYCKTCMFSNGDPPFEDLPEKAYCMVYRRKSGISKPNAVYYDGEKCEFYKKDAE